MDTKINHMKQGTIEKKLVGKVMLRACAKGSEKLDVFSTWMLAAFAAGLAFLIDKSIQDGSFIDPGRVKCIAWIFLFGLLSGLAGKVLSTMIATLASGHEAGEAALKSLPQPGPDSATSAEIPFSVPVLLEEIVANSRAPTLRFALLGKGLVEQGDFAFPGRWGARLFRWQLGATIAQCSSCIAAVAFLGWTLPG